MAKQSVAEQFVGILVRAGVQRLYGCRLGDPVRGRRGTRTGPGAPSVIRRVAPLPPRARTGRTPTSACGDDPVGMRAGRRGMHPREPVRGGKTVES